MSEPRTEEEQTIAMLAGPETVIALLRERNHLKAAVEGLKREFARAEPLDVEVAKSLHRADETLERIQAWRKRAKALMADIDEILGESE